ncbi:MAG TPA: MarR family transcriptional regulator [Solirubrobacter sp.]|nr:MarR family transcriptional regulator [Solirubrobacter sp.]
MSPTSSDPALLAAELRVTLGRLMRRLRVEHTFPIGQGEVLGRLDREGPQSISDLAAKAKMRPQSMAQTVRELESDGFVARRPDPDDGRRFFIELTGAGRDRLASDRRRRDGWLAIGLAEELTPEERATLAAAAPLLRRIADR